MSDKNVLQDLFSQQNLDYLNQVPYNVARQTLYCAAELFDSPFFEQCHDSVVYRHVVATDKVSPSPVELWARTVHDYHIRLAMHSFLRGYERNKVVGIMGGHQLKRSDPMYRLVVTVAKSLTEQGYLMISGGGPGAMEATHLGAWLAGRPAPDVDVALSILGVAQCYADDGWLESSLDVISRLPQLYDFQSLSVPTWFYGHEPPTAFATHIAKFFDNSVREDTILTEAYGGLVFMPGSAGTLQEIFQEAVQDHYVSLGYPSPMIFVGSDFWQNKIPVYPFMTRMLQTGQYKNLLLTLADSAPEVIKAVVEFA